MTEFFRRHNLLVTAVVLIMVSCRLMSASIEDASLPRLGGRILYSIFGPIEKTHHEVVVSIDGVWSHYIALQNIESERNQLLVRIKNLESENSKLIEYANENARLKSLLHFEEETGNRGVAATVVGRDPSNWARTVTIDRGSDHGVRVGLPVVDGNAIVGQIISVSLTTSKVLLLTDNTSAIDAIVQASRAEGIVEGMLEDRLRLRYVLRDFPVTLGDRIVASGLDGIFPKGALIGVVTKVEPAGNGLFQNIEVQPSVDLSRLESVLIIFPEHRTAPQPNLTEDGAAKAAGE